ncbi:signal recognition particle 14kD protein, putative [Talaromyces stipitatus ATCC 10500]|uniref:Signal recognition particle subunit SRP14 n=1 Tax=Talaromyces stipitatus (strain ATCC 10500 / CBS 375.48 / QM 6759 / NRRL 1006) TaxID=441959 RepID=B8MCK5_TALSN|nr:signal recognition particle 14kD protein, putative [Talaromyces stipitatus ATCC 10500]EED18821.1 signal recognition particle 14kD protein, putative [Talaromyces stipitatus ATCC 10500]
MAPHLSNDEFFASLTNLFTNTTQKTKGSIYLTQKRLPSSFSDQSTPEGSILVRATDGRTQNPNPRDSKDSKVSKKKVAPKVKISTVVSPADLELFFVRYADVCKAGMVALKKRDRSAKKKGKAKAKTTKG